MSYLLESVLDPQRVADCRAGDAEREAAERALFKTVAHALQPRGIHKAEVRIDCENCCDTVPGDIDVAHVLRESNWGGAFFWYGAPVAAVLGAAWAIFKSLV
jgi:hypothetical protein